MWNQKNQYSKACTRKKFRQNNLQKPKKKNKEKNKKRIIEIKNLNWKQIEILIVSLKILKLPKENPITQKIISQPKKVDFMNNIWHKIIWIKIEFSSWEKIRSTQQVIFQILQLMWPQFSIDLELFQQKMRKILKFWKRNRDKKLNHSKWKRKITNLI